MKNNGFENLFKKLFGGENRVVFEMFIKGEKISIDSVSYRSITENISANLIEMSDISGKGGYIGIKMQNSPYMYAVIFASMMSGFSPLLIDVRSSEKQCSELLAEAKATSIITDKAGAFGEGVSVIEASKLYEPCSAPTEPCWNNEIAFSTSGTTGKSKIIVYDSTSLFYQVDRTAEFFKNSAAMESALGRDNAEENKFISILPINHILGFTTPLIILDYGFKLIFPPNAAISSIIKTIAEERVWGCIGVPMFWQTLYNLLMSRMGCITSETVKAMLGDKFKFMLSGGTKTDNKLRDAFNNAGMCFTLGYGMTEVGCATMLFPSETDCYSEGALYEWYDCIIRKDDGTLSENGIGELLIKSDVIFKGYRANGIFEERESTPEGYYPTGDIFRKDGKVIYFVGRCKNVIVNSSGENIYIEELEDHFRGLINYTEMFGIINLGDEPCIVAKVKSADDISELKSLLTEKNSELPVYMRPCKAVITTRDLPVTSKGELKKIAVTDELLNDESNVEIIFKKDGK